VLALLFGVPLVFADGKAKQAAPDYTAEAGRRAVFLMLVVAYFSSTRTSIS
jgi:hypothetical protein